MKVTIEKISRKEKVSKNGKPFVSVGIFVNGGWCSGFNDEVNSKWRVGDIVDVEITQNGDFKNFKAIDPIQGLEARILALEVKLGVAEPDFTNDANEDVF